MVLGVVAQDDLTVDVPRPASVLAEAGALPTWLHALVHRVRDAPRPGA